MTYIIVILLVLLSGLFSGLTLGLLSLDKNELKRKIAVKNKDSIKAKKVYGVRKKGNLLLCTLLLGNVAVNSTLAIFLGDIASGFMAGIIATGLIVIFGEIIPQATFSRYALEVGAKTVWLVKIFIFILYPFTFPIAWVLDKTLGEEMPTIYSKRELMKIIEEHEDVKESDVDADEERIVKGALSFSDKTAEQIMTPRTVVYALEEQTVLSDKILKQIQKKGFTRIPIYEKRIDNIIGVLYVKNLIGLEKNIKVKDILKNRKLIIIDKNYKLDKLLNKFINVREHIAFVKDEYGGLQGVVTLEDVVEEVLKLEIVDETDKVVDLQKLAREKRTH